MKVLVSTACTACREANCRDFRGLGLDLIAGCFENPDSTFVDQCTNATLCALAHDCAYTSRGAETCYCGTASSAQCQQGVGIDGACAPEFEAAAGSSDSQFVTTHFGDLSLPIGNAVFLLQCDRDFCMTDCTP